MRKFAMLFIALIVLVSSVIPVSAEPLSDDIVILYTNDIHTYIDGELSYDVIAAIKKELQKLL